MIEAGEVQLKKKTKTKNSTASQLRNISPCMLASQLCTQTHTHAHTFHVHYHIIFSPLQAYPITAGISVSFFLFSSATLGSRRSLPPSVHVSYHLIGSSFSPQSSQDDRASGCSPVLDTITSCLLGTQIELVCSPVWSPTVHYGPVI